MDKSINIILKEVIDNFIKEELSINNELENAVEDAAIKILEKYRNNDIIDERTISIMYKDTIYSIPLVTLLYEIELKPIGKIPCEISIYNIKDNDVFDKIYTELDFRNDFNINNNRIEITAYSINGGINYLMLRNLIYHECEHALQYFMSGGTVKTNDSYIKAKNIIQGKDNFHSSKHYNDVAWLIYYYQKSEIDANINGLYGEMMTDKSIEFKNTNFNQTNIELNGIFDNFIKNIENDDLNNVLQYFGFNKKKFVNYILKQQKYLSVKTKRVLWLVRNKKMSINEGIKTIKNKLKHKPNSFYVK